MSPLRTDMLAVMLSLGLLATIPGNGRAQSGSADPGICPGCDAGALIRDLGLQEAPAPVRERKGWSPPQRIIVWGEPEEVRWFGQAAPGVELVRVSSVAEAVREAPGADAYIGRCNSAVLLAGADIRWVQHPSAGVEGCVEIPEFRERGILLTNAQRLYGPVIAEHSIGLTLALARNFRAYHRAQAREQWAGAQWLTPQSPMMELAGKTMLVVGLGGIGTEVARRAKALGMRVVATRRSSRQGPDFVDYVGLPHELGELTAEADFVLNAAPLTDETRGMFDAPFFRTMKPTAFFLNVARGGSVVTRDLVAALEAGRLAGAALDVTDPEPLPRGHPLWSMPNVIITPHVSAAADGSIHRLRTLTRENLRRYAAGEPMLSVVDVRRGY